MEAVKLVESLNVREVKRGGRDEVEMFRYSQAFSPVPEDCFLIGDDIGVEKDIVSIHIFNNSGWDKPLYVAYSKEVQELLEMPFDILKSDAERLEKEVGYWRKKSKDNMKFTKIGIATFSAAFFFVGLLWGVM